MSFIIDTCAEASKKKKRNKNKRKLAPKKKLHQRYKSETDHQIRQRISKVFLMA